MSEAMAAAWGQADAFPVIVRVVEAGSASGDDYMTHDQITAALLADEEGASLINTARDELGEEHTADWIAHNMVAWFGQRITVGESDWADGFDRKQVDGKWAYRPRV